MKDKHFHKHKNPENPAPPNADEREISENPRDENSENCEIYDNGASVDSGEILAQKDTELAALEDKYKRMYADFENTKKRLEREKYQALDYANEGILKDFLPVLDTLESAISGLQNGAEGVESTQDSTESTLDSATNKIYEGIKLTIDNFTKALQKHGVEAIDTSGEFDPNVHNAIMQVKNEAKPNGSISQVIQKGYIYKGRILRPAMVSITKND